MAQWSAAEKAWMAQPGPWVSVAVPGEKNLEGGGTGKRNQRMRKVVRKGLVGAVGAMKARARLWAPSAPMRRSPVYEVPSGQWAVIAVEVVVMEETLLLGWRADWASAGRVEKSREVRS
jgi:hypothetical protein